MLDIIISDILRSIKVIRMYIYVFYVFMTSVVLNSG